ncbi:MAG TPA: hydantoinase/oxoprolinase family protein, partial [Terriglobia bacterium]|nr:hydantoinase/oxoprolinase family protein [Terriglobia bacterium]
EMRAEGIPAKDISAFDAADMRYRGQSYELTIPLTGSWPTSFVTEFHKAHERRYGYSNSDKPVEVVNVRTTFVGRSAKPQFRAAPRVRGAARPLESQMVWMDRRRRNTAIYDRTSLRHGHVIHGPAIIGEYSSTTMVPSDFVCKIDPHLNLVLEKL